MALAIFVYQSYNKFGYIERKLFVFEISQLHSKNTFQIPMPASNVERVQILRTGTSVPGGGGGG